jgi:hypothetical protein
MTAGMIRQGLIFYLKKYPMRQNSMAFLKYYINGPKYPFDTHKRNLGNDLYN